MSGKSGCLRPLTCRNGHDDLPGLGGVSGTTTANITDFTANLRGRGLADNTISNYAGRMTRFAIWLQADAGEDMGAAGAVDAQEYLRSLLGDRKPGSVQVARDALQAWFAWRGVDGVKLRVPPREAVTAPKALSRQDQYRLRRAALASGPRAEY